VILSPQSLSPKQRPIHYATIPLSLQTKQAPSMRPQSLAQELRLALKPLLRGCAPRAVAGSAHPSV
jgi:hypothetical protein